MSLFVNMVKVIDLILEARWTYFGLGLIFLVFSYWRGEFYLESNYFGLGFWTLILSVLLILSYRIWKRKW